MLGQYKTVERVGKRQELMDDMLDTMYSANGIGLAAIHEFLKELFMILVKIGLKEQDFCKSCYQK